VHLRGLQSLAHCVESIIVVFFKYNNKLFLYWTFDQKTEHKNQKLFSIYKLSCVVFELSICNINHLTFIYIYFCLYRSQFHQHLLMIYLSRKITSNLQSLPGYDEDPETQYLRNWPPNQFLYIMKSCAELRKIKILAWEPRNSSQPFIKLRNWFGGRFLRYWVSGSASYPGIDSRNPWKAHTKSF